MPTTYIIKTSLIRLNELLTFKKLKKIIFYLEFIFIVHIYLLSQSTGNFLNFILEINHEPDTLQQPLEFA